MTPSGTDAFTITYPGTGEITAASIAGPNTALPAGILVTNTFGTQSTLTGSITNAGNSTYNSYSDTPNGFTFQGLGLVNGTSGSTVASSIGPNITVTNTGSLVAEVFGPVGGAYVPSGLINALSTGANGYDTPKNGAYDAGAGGSVAVSLNGGTLTSYLNVPVSQAAVPLKPYTTGLYAASVGGKGTATSDQGGQLGTGGAGGAVTVATAPGTNIVLDGAGMGSALMNGITALSQGGAPGSFTSGPYLYIGTPGVGGPVGITHAGTITGYTQTSIGISAFSIGGTPDQLPSGTTIVSPAPVAGGAVSVSLAPGGAISLLGGNAIGILAASADGQAPASVYGSTGEAATSGTVTVNLAANSLISVGPGLTQSASGLFDAGVLAISTGSAAVLAPFGSSTVNVGSGGYGGSVAVTNAGSITTSGQLAVGIAAVSTGGAGILTNASASGVSYLGSTASGVAAQGGTVAVVNNGEITTNGASAFGIVAISGGAGGILGADANAVLNGDTVSSGVIVGGGGSSGASPGGTVSVTNTGFIATGDGQGGGNLAIGILAQSIGGGGGSSGGNGAAAFVGDSGGGGGAGGGVTVTTSGGQITTLDDGAIGILAQSIGGGGGNGGNAKGLFVATGGRGGSGGAGGDVTVMLGSGGTGGLITTSGDFAAGVLEQSVGGGGGNGGYAKSHGLFVSTAIGGAGGGGGAGGAATFLNTDASIITTGEQSHGALVQSVGGGGGNGGAGNAFSAGVIFSASVAVGGTGGSGGSGGTVSATNQGQISTSGADSIGLVAQSVGGGGGNAGSALAKSLAFPLDDPPLPTISFSAAIGGAGGTASAGGTVSVANQQGSIATQGNGGIGILAQSVGGGGGNGGDSTAAASAWLGDAPTFKVGVSVGGSGGGGGNGGSVTVSNETGTASIQTSGNNATAILAQSIGGGGGNGGGGNATVASQNLGGTPGVAVSLSSSVGGTGGGAGGGGTTTVTNASGGSIVTTGSGSQGILAQSIGGGGGSGGGGAAAGSGDVVNLNVAVGGSGKGGGSGGGVTVTNAGTIATGLTYASNGVTTGGDAVGIMAQSIGGGGGVAGSSDAAATFPPLAQVENVINTPAAGYSANVAVGGSGGGGGGGGTVQVTNSGGITTLGERAFGIMAQSIGGGGGVGGAATSAAGSVLGERDPTTDSGYTYSGTISVSGSGGSGGNGGSVTVTNSGSVGTAGYGATGVLAQSIGGGGGVGADGTVNNHASIGLGADVNGAGGTAGGGGAVNVNNPGTIITVGDDAYGILAQSIGGGGGLGSAGCTNSGSASYGLTASRCIGNTNTGVSGASVPWIDSSSFAVRAGGGSGASGFGGPVTVTQNGWVITTGARSFGLVAQSIGGGGGITTAAAQNIGSTNVASPAGQNYAKGGAVEVILNDQAGIETFGAGAWGILAQSIGGGGGFVGDPSMPIAVPISNTLPDKVNSSAYYPDSGTVTVQVAGYIATTGANAHGIVAQAIGGGGMASGGNNSSTATVDMGNSEQIYNRSNATYAGEGMAVTITQNPGSIISTSGPGSIAIVAQSSGKSDYTQPINVTIGGTVIGGTNVGAAPGGVGAAGVLLSGGVLAGSTVDGGATGNTVTVNAGGSLGTVDGINGVAIITTSGQTYVVNHGTITGSFNLDTDPSTITNDGLINTGSVVIANSFTNEGKVDIFGRGVVGTTHIYGDYIQTGRGVLGADIDALAGQTSDRLVVSGNVQFGGRIAPAARTLLPGIYTMLTADSLSLTGGSAQQALLFNWGLRTDGRSVSLSPSAHLIPDNVPLSPSQVSLASYLTNAWNQSDRFFASLFGYHSQIQTASQYITTANALSVRPTQALPAEMENSAQTLLGAALSCPVFVDQGTLLGEDSCAWGKFTGGWTNHGSNDSEPGYNVDATTYRLGAQKQFAPGWFLGGSLGAGVTWATSNGSTSHGDTYDGSLAIKHTAGPWLFAGSVALANEAFHTNRVVDLPDMGTATGYNAVLQSDSSVFLAGGRARAAYEFTFGNTYLRPYGDLDVVYTHTPNFQESGSQNLALSVGGTDKTSVVLSPMVEFGGRYNVDKTTILRPYMAAGVSFHPDNTRTVTSSFTGGLASDGTFQTVVQSPNVVGNIDFGAQLYRERNFEVRAEYGMHVGQSYLAQTASARFAWHF